jgi:hypothetical protein
VFREQESKKYLADVSEPPQLCRAAAALVRRLVGVVHQHLHKKHTPSGLNFPYACPEPVLVKLISFRFRYKNGSKKVVFRTSIAFVVILSTILQWLSIPCTQ